jgi:hypothetical protein
MRLSNSEKLKEELEWQKIANLGCCGLGSTEAICR